HRHADAVLDRPERVEAFQLGDHGGPGVARHAAQPDQRRVADSLRDVVVDPAAEARWLCHGNLLSSSCSEEKERSPSLSSVFYEHCRAKTRELRRAWRSLG